MHINDEPLIHTTKGNLPVSALTYDTRWEMTDTYVKFVERYLLGGEVVKESAHVLGLKGLFCEALTPPLDEVPSLADAQADEPLPNHTVS